MKFQFTAASGVGFFMLCVFGIIAVGYLLGRITIKGISLGSAGVFIIALVFGCFLYTPLTEALVIKTSSTDTVTYVSDALKIIENIGLMFFVTAVGFIAGPSFVANFKKNFKSYVLLGLIIIVSGALACVGCVLIDQGLDISTFPELAEQDANSAGVAAMMVGLFAGALTSTPAFSAAKGAVATNEVIGAELESIISTGYGIAYLFGVIGVVLFVQLIPKITKANMEEEVKKIKATDTGKKAKNLDGLMEMDDFGLMPLALAIVIGIAVGSLKFGNFSLTTTGGCLLAGLVFGHFGKIGKISIMPKATTLKCLRELGLILFLLGAGISGGARFVDLFKPVYFLYGVIMTIVPMIIGFLFAKFVLKLPLFNNLGSITGGMTSTPALGTLINVAKTEDVATAYAATYPIALISVVLAAQFILMAFC